MGVSTLVRPVRELKGLTFCIGAGVGLSYENEEEGGRTWEAEPLS